MTQKTITIAGKEARLAYCYATEIAFKSLSGEETTDFIQEAVESIQKERMPDVQKSIQLILAAMIAHEQATGEKSALTDSDLMLQATPKELGTALGTVIGLRADFYFVPAGEPEDKPHGKDGRGAKKRKNA